MDNGQIPDSRRVLYYVGIALIGIGIAIFFKFGFLTPFPMTPSVESELLPPFGPAALLSNEKPFIERAQEAADAQTKGCLFGMALALIGGVLMSIGREGLAGSGVILDPRQAREDLEPWSRLKGGIVADALDEAKIDFSGLKAKYGTAELPFDERLRRLDQLRKDGLVSEAEYAEARKRILADA